MSNIIPALMNDTDVQVINPVSLCMCSDCSAYEDEDYCSRYGGIVNGFASGDEVEDCLWAINGKTLTCNEEEVTRVQFKTDLTATELVEYLKTTTEPDLWVLKKAVEAKCAEAENADKLVWGYKEW